MEVQGSSNQWSPARQGLQVFQTCYHRVIYSWGKHMQMNAKTRQGFAAALQPLADLSLGHCTEKLHCRSVCFCMLLTSMSMR